MLRPCSQSVALSLRYESQILGYRTAASVTIMMHVTVSECGQIHTKTNGEWANHAGSYAPDQADVLVTVMQMECCHSSSPRIFIKGLTSYKTTPETLANNHHSLRLRPRQDFTHRVMLNNCVSAHWSLMCHYLALTSLRDIHSLATRHSRESVRH